IGIYLAAPTRLGRTGRYWSPDRIKRSQVLADLDRGLVGRGARRLGFVLDRPQARISSRAYVAAFPSSRSHSAGGSLHEEMGRSGNFHRPLLWAAAGDCAA